MAGPKGEDGAGRRTPFRIDVERSDGRIVVIVARELDLATAPLLVREVTGELSNPVTSLAIDLVAWLAAMAVVAPGGGPALRLTEPEVERAPIRSADAIGSP